MRCFTVQIFLYRHRNNQEPTTKRYRTRVFTQLVGCPHTRSHSFHGPGLGAFTNYTQYHHQAPSKYGRSAVRQHTVRPSGLIVRFALNIAFTIRRIRTVNRTLWDAGTGTGRRLHWTAALLHAAPLSCKTRRDRCECESTAAKHAEAIRVLAGPSF